MVTMPPPYPPHPWTNQHLTLYHGMVDVHVPSILRGVNVAQSRVRTDFGQGFYTTTVEHQARSWAWHAAQRRPRTLPVVICFDVNRNDLAGLDSLWFLRGSFDAEDFWSLVFHCRAGGSHQREAPHMWYDIVGGPVAASWRQRLTLHDVDQVSFHTPRAATLLDRSNPRTMP
jgi:Protein of unknown function (DUF3990)